MSRVVLALVLGLIAGRVEALPIFLSGFDIADTSSSNTDEIEFVEAPTGVADANINIVSSTGDARGHDTANGGTDSSPWTGHAVVTTGNNGYYELASDLPSTYQTLCGAVNLHVKTYPTNATERRAIFALLDKGNPVDPSCALAVDSTGHGWLYYAGGNSGIPTCAADGDCAADEICIGTTGGAGSGTCRKSWGQTQQTFMANACNNHPHLACSNAAADCPAGDTCTAFYYAGIEVCATQQSGAAVVCELWWDGNAATTNVAKTIPGSPVGTITNVGVGVLGGNATGFSTVGAAEVYFDDLVLDDSGDRAGHGFVATKVVNANGTPQAWTDDSCAGSNHVNCMNDFGVTPFRLQSATNSVLRRSVPNKQEMFGGMSLLGALPAGDLVTAVEGVLVGSTSSGNATRQIDQRLAFGGSATVVSPVVTVTTTNDQTTKVRSRLLLTQSPVLGQTDLSLNYDTITQGFDSGPLNADIMRVAAGLLYVRVEEPDTLGAGSVQTLIDHNGDGKVVMLTAGDSTLVGTAESHVLGGPSDGDICTQKSYCSWDASEQRDHPTGGCNGDAECQSCANRRQEFNRGAGYVPSDGICNLGSCTGGSGVCGTTAGTCGGDTTVSCGCNADCDLGTLDTTSICKSQAPGQCTCSSSSDCDSSRTCTNGVCTGGDGPREFCDGTFTSTVQCAAGKSCVNAGTCPNSRAGWASPLVSKLQPDTLLACAVGGERWADLLKRMPGYLNGAESTCTALTGTGVCQCTTNADCGGGGTCNVGTGLCSAGLTACRAYNGCLNGNLCNFGRPDYVAIVAGYNDPFIGSGDYPGSYPAKGATYGGLECLSTNAFPTVAACPSVAASGRYTQPDTACTQDSDCASASGGWNGSPWSRCAGVCTKGTCSVTTTKRCIVNGDCPSGETCTAPPRCAFASVFGNCGPFIPCTVSVDTCAKTADCPRSQTCDLTGITPTADLAGTSQQPGTCRPASNANCAAGFKAIGAANGKLCRLACTGPSDTTTCGPSATCATVNTPNADADGTFVCRGKCHVPCDAIACTTDADCAVGTDGVFAVPDGVRPRRIHGTCNQARGRCACCGLATCPGLTTGPCSCSTNAECDTSSGSGDGVCDSTVKRCTAGKPARLACSRDADCATGRQCLSCRSQQAEWLAGYQGEPLEIAHRMKTLMDASQASPPVLLVGELPMVGGLASTLVSSSALQEVKCNSTWADRDYFTSIGRNFDAATSWLPARHVFHVPAFQNTRMSVAFHADQAHFSKLGGTDIGNEIFATALSELNVCTQNATYAPQLYCRRQTGVWSRRCTCTLSSQCGTGGSCNLTKQGGVCELGDAAHTACTQDSDCGGGGRTCKDLTCATFSDCVGTELCLRRKCTDGAGVPNDANCPAAGDFCQAD